MPKIKTPSGYIHYKTYPLYNGIKFINKKLAQENLCLLKEILDNYYIQFGLIAGTLLGAVREQDFITHDEDVDLFFLEENKQKLLNILPILILNGFQIARYDRRGLLSIIRKGEYIDLYFFSKYEKDVRICSGWLIPEPFLINTSMIPFLGNLFNVPTNYKEYLKYEYGENWQEPVIYKRKHINRFRSFLLNLKEYIKEQIPNWLYFKLVKYSENKLLNIYFAKLDKYNKKKQ